MGTTFRKSMGLLHTWTGVVIGGLLFAIFWMGTLSVFDREIDRWMMPGTRLSSTVAEQPVKLDGPISEMVNKLTVGSPQWFIRLPSDRVPAIELRWRDEKTKTTERRFLHPQTGEVLEHTDTLAGTGFIFPFHYSLHLKWKDVGYWLVGLAGMAMMVMVVSGVVIHRKIFTDFLLFRPQKKTQRASLDLHNLMAVLGMPFHFFLALSGIIIFVIIYWPSGYSAAYPEAKDVPAARQAFNADGFGNYKRAKAGPSDQPMASLDAMRAEARQQWKGGEANFVRVWHPGNKASYVELRRSYADTITMNIDQIYFDATTGKTLKNFSAAPAMTVQRFISGLHFVQFEHWTLRWMYFLAGLSGCIMIATGFVFWLESRRDSHTSKGLQGVRVVEALAVASVPGIVVATLVFFVVNRLLPLNATWAGNDRSTLEMWAFYAVWVAALGHAALRKRVAWREQAWAIVVLALVAVLLNAATTGHHLGASLSQGLWAVAGMDLLLLLTSGLALVAARKLPANGELAITKAQRAAAQTRQGSASHA